MENKKSSVDDEFIEFIEKNPPQIPKEFINFWLMKYGLICEDSRVQNLISFLLQKFFDEILDRAIPFSETRTRKQIQTEKNDFSLKLEDLVPSIPRNQSRIPVYLFDPNFQKYAQQENIQRRKRKKDDEK
ncbi:transcription initiation factor tfiid subunit 10 [Anaeramoeba ignava]|uniref:Transcription initiation factor tfiid subunit 10 n=1 Tax=Anaeramoeba ignava TaxID=1746090 RepID=A0A9Q0R682_ANAIG|nr:transcription initiation factor tfiid subunit 10 [Anaeramoeba ignava]